MKKSNFSDLDYFILESCRKSLFSKGIDLSHKQILNRIKKLRYLYSKFNKTQYSLIHLWTIYNLDPPSPPYNYFFETQKEAMGFAERAKNKYNVVCDIKLQGNVWKLVGEK